MKSKNLKFQHIETRNLFHSAIQLEIKLNELMEIKKDQNEKMVQVIQIKKALESINHQMEELIQSEKQYL